MHLIYYILSKRKKKQNEYFFFSIQRVHLRHIQHLIIDCRGWKSFSEENNKKKKKKKISFFYVSSATMYNIKYKNSLK